MDTLIVTGKLSFVYNESENLTVRLTDIKGTPIPNASLRIILDFIDKNLTTDSNGEVQLPLNKLPCGTFDGNISYEGKTRFASSNSSIKVVINKIPTQITAFDMVCNYGDESYFTATLKDKYGNPLNNTKITLKVNGESLTNISNDNGEAKFLISLPAGTHEAEVIFDGNDTYNASSTRVSITVNRTSVSNPSKITVKNTISQYNGGKYLIVTLSDINGNIISGANVKVSLNGKNNVLTTDLNGQVKVSLNNLKPRTYNAKIIYDGDNNHLNTSLSANIVILKATPKLVAKNKSFKLKTKTKKYAVTFKTNTGKKFKKAKLTLKVKGKIYRAVTNSKGKATFKITKLTKKGKFKAVIKFSGDKNYKKVSKKVKIRVK